MQIALLNDVSDGANELQINQTINDTTHLCVVQ